jgi:hypothetical protein
MHYEPPAIEGRQPIARPYVLGIITSQPSPTWTDQPEEESA